MREENKKMKIKMKMSMENNTKEDQIINNAKHEELQVKIDYIHDSLMLTLKGTRDIRGSSSRPFIKTKKCRLTQDHTVEYITYTKYIIRINIKYRYFI